MEWNEIKDRLDLAIEQFMANDAYLLQVDANERSLTHQLATYMKPLFAPYSVDCEYNRNGLDPKVILNELLQKIDNDDTDASTVYPDIIVHKRGSNDENLLVIEAKKSSSNDDIIKLNAYMKDEHLSYQHAVFLRFSVKKNVGVVYKRVGGEATA